GEVGAGKAWCAARDDADIDVFAERNLSCVDFQDTFATTHVGTRHHDATIETTGPQQRGIEHVRTIRRSNQYYAIVRFKAVHFNQQLIQRLFAFVMSSTEAGTAVTTYGINLIDEDDAGRVLLALFKEIA